MTEERVLPVAVSPEIEEAVLERVRSGHYRSIDHVLTVALRLLAWAETDPVGKAELVRLAAAHAGAGDSEAEAGTAVSGEGVPARTPAPSRRRLPLHPARRGRLR